MDFSTIEITSKKVRGNNVDFSTSEIKSKKVHGNIVNFSTSKITSKKVRGNQVDFSTIETASKKYAEMTWKFVEIWSSTYRRNIYVESTWIRRGVPVGLLAFKTSWRRLEDMSWRSLQHVFSVTVLRLPRRLEDVLKTTWKTKKCYDEDVLKTCLEDVLKTCLEDVLKTLWRQAKYLLGISVSNKSKCVSNKSIFHKSISDKSKANPKCVT